MHKIRIILVVILLAIFSRVAVADEAPTSLAVIVNSAIKQESISMDNLKKMLIGDIRFWEGGELITLLIQAPVSWERDTLLSQVMEMSEPQYRQFWISKVFRTEVASGPKVVLSNEMAAILVSKIPGAMAFVNNDEIPIDTRVLKIDGFLPDDENYPLKFVSSSKK